MMHFCFCFFAKIYLSSEMAQLGEFPKILTPGSSPGRPPPPWVCQGHSGNHEVRCAHQPEEDGDQVQAVQDHVSATCGPGARLG